MDGWGETSMESGRERGAGVIQEKMLRDGVLWEGGVRGMAGYN